MFSGMGLSECEERLDLLNQRLATSIKSSISYGLASRVEGDDPATLIARADLAMYERRRKGDVEEGA